MFTGTFFSATLFFSFLCLQSWAQNPLFIPDTLTGPVFNLEMQNGTYQFSPGITSDTKGFNGNILGPTLIMHNGQQVCMNVTNHIGEQTTVHWHGLHVLAENDGGPHTVIDPNTIWSPCFKVMNKAATYWYHPHLHEFTNKHVTQGLSGLIIVRDAEEAALALPRTYGVDDFPLIIQTRAISSTGVIQYDVSSTNVSVNNPDTYLTINAVKDAKLNVPAQCVRFRVLNGSKQRVFLLGLSNGASLHQIASDDGLLALTHSVNRIRIAPGERVELIIDFGAYTTGTNLQLKSFASELPNGTWGATNAFSSPNVPGGGLNPLGYTSNSMNGADFDLLKFHVVAQTTNPVLTIPSTLAIVTPLSAASATSFKDKYLFNANGDGPRIGAVSSASSAVPFNMNTIDDYIGLGTTAIWTLHGAHNQYHPFHLHDVPFYVLDRKDSFGNYIPLTASEQGLKDVVYVGPKETVRFITKFNDFWSDVPYMYHCHITHHEDRGMMKQFIVTDQLYVDKNSTAPFQVGTEAFPYLQLTDALSAANNGTTIYFKSNGNHEEISPGSILLTKKKVTLKVLSGDVIIK